MPPLEEPTMHPKSFAPRLLTLVAVSVSTGLATAQFGGDGRDGALRPTADITLDTTSNGAGWSYTAIDIPAGVTVRLIGDRPAILRSQGAVRIAGRLVADGFLNNGQTPGRGGPGGYAGGSPGRSGQGPGGGRGGLISIGGGRVVVPGAGAHQTPGFNNNNNYGSDWPFDLRGGSGNGGFHNAADLSRSTGGSGGGGVIVLLADRAVTVEAGGQVTADGAGRAGGSGGCVFVRSATDIISQTQVVSAAQFALESFRRDLTGNLPENPNGTKLEGKMVGTLVTVDARLLLCYDGDPLNEIADWAAPDRVMVYEVQGGQLIRTDQQSGAAFVVANNVSDFTVTQLASGLRIELTFERGNFTRTYTLISEDP